MTDKFIKFSRLKHSDNIVDIDHIYQALCYSVAKHMPKVFLAKSAVVAELRVLSNFGKCRHPQMHKTIRCAAFVMYSYFQLNAI